MRSYVEKCLSFGLASWFAETYSWDEMPGPWKDVRRIGADLRVDDRPHHREAAARHGLADRYVIVPIHGGPEDVADPLAWERRYGAGVGIFDGPRRYQGARVVKCSGCQVDSVFSEIGGFVEPFIRLALLPVSVAGHRLAPCCRCRRRFRGRLGPVAGEGYGDGDDQPSSP